MTKVSCIVPVYNTSKFLGSCINSLINQTIDNYEIIFINDCSTDNSLDILRYYEKLYPYKIKIINLEENKGVSYARNIGLSYANGEFIYFMDSDDVVSINFLNDFYKLCKKEDVNIAISNCFRINHSEMLGNSIFLGKSSNNYKRVNIDYQPNTFDIIDVGVWDKLFKHDIIPRKPFIEGKVFEDIAFVHPLILKNKNLCLWLRNDYAYRYTPNSIMESHYHPMPSIIDIIDVCKYSMLFGKIIGLNDGEILRICEFNKQFLLKKMYIISNWYIDDNLKDTILKKYGRVCKSLFGNFNDAAKTLYYEDLLKYFIDCNNPEFELDLLKKKVKLLNN